MKDDQSKETMIINETLPDEVSEAIWKDICESPDFVKDWLIGSWDDTHGLLTLCGAVVAHEDK